MAQISAEIVARGGQIRHRFGRMLRGFSASIPAEYATELRLTPGVTVETDGLVTTIDGSNRRVHGSSHEGGRHSPRDPSP
ncbi:hypothetical protein T492DRAFT_1005980 [Pavlovales sp. CCMP2436]|nr:hypothetical protein T492DRAFT_1005980 [Pavlovales sp. CCMP2436]